MRSVRVLRNVISNYLRFFLGVAIAFFLTPFTVHALGDRDYGLWITVMSLTGYFGLFDQGIRPSLVRYVSRDRASGDREGLSRTISSAFLLYAIVGALTLLVTVVVAFHFADWFRIEPALRSQTPVLVLLVGATIALGFPLGVFGAVLSGLQRYDIANGIGITIIVLRSLAFVVVLLAGGGLLALAWTSLVANLLGHLVTAIAAWRQLPGLPVGLRWVSRGHLRMIGSYSGYSFVGALATNLAFQTDALVITRFLGPAFATPFSFASGLVDNARTLVHSATWVLSPTASEMDTTGERDGLRAMLIRGSQYSVLVSWPVLFGLVLFGASLLHTWVGESYRPASLLLTVLALPTLIALPQSSASSVLFGIGRHRGVVALSILSAVANLLLSLWWVQHTGWIERLFGHAIAPGLVGVALGTAVPLALVSGVATLVYACRCIELPIGRYLWHGLLRPGLVSLAFVPPALLLRQVVAPVGWLPLGACCFASWLVFLAVCWRYGIDAGDRERWAKTVTRMLRPGTAAVEGGR